MPDPPHHCSTLLLEIINLKPPLEASVPSLWVCQLVSEFKSRHHGFSTQCCLSLHGHILDRRTYNYTCTCYTGLCVPGKDSQAELTVFVRDVADRPPSFSVGLH